MKSIAQKIAQLEGLLGTRDLSEWETGFVTSLVDRLEEAQGRPINLSPKQLDALENLYGKHFA